MISGRAYSQESMPFIHRSQSLVLSIALQAAVLWLADGSIALAQAERDAALAQSFELQPLSTEPGTSAVQYRTVAAALEALETATVSTYGEIVEALKAMGIQAMPELRQALTVPNPRVSSAAAEVLGRFGSDAAPAIPDLLAAVGDRSSWKSTSAGVFFGILPTFPVFGEENPVPTAPANPQGIVGVSAIAALGQIGTAAKPTAAPVLTDLLNDPNPWVQLNSAWTLMQMGAEVPVLPTYVALLQQRESSVRQATASVLDDNTTLVAQVLRQEATSAQIDLFIQLLGDDEQTLHFKMQSVLSKLGAKVVPPLIAALDQPNTFLQLQATQTLEDVGGEAIAALPRLSEQLNDPTQYQSPSTLGEAGFSTPTLWGDPIPLLSLDSFSARPSYKRPSNPDQALNVAAALSIGTLGQTQPSRVNQNALRQKLNDPNPRMRLAVAWAILSTTQPEASTTQAQRQYWSEQSALTQAVGEVVQINNQPTGSIAPLQYGSLQRESLDLLESIGKPAAEFLVPYYGAQLTATYAETPEQTVKQIQQHRAGAMIRLGELGVGSVEAVPLLRDRFLDGSDDVLRGYSATILGQIAMDAQRQALQGFLPKAKQQQVMAELLQVVAVMQSGRYRFNAEPVERVMTALDVLGRL